jgi:hypothetical protein
MGGTSKPHAMYMRYWNLLKKPPIPQSKNFPDLEGLIKEAKEDGSINSKGGASGASEVGGTKRARKGKKTAKVDESDDEHEVTVKKTKINDQEGSGDNSGNMDV